MDLPVFVGVPYYILVGGFNGASGGLSLAVDLVATTNACFDHTPYTILPNTFLAKAKVSYKQPF